MSFRQRILRIACRLGAGASILVLGGGICAHGQREIRPTNAQRATNGDVVLGWTAPAGAFVRLEVSEALPTWRTTAMIRAGAGTNSFVDSAAARVRARFYRAVEAAEANPLTGDHVPTGEGDVVIHPIDHASLVLGLPDRTLYVDPVGGAGLYEGLARADVILVTHSHGDHFHGPTLLAVAGPEGIVVAPPAVYGSLPSALKARAVSLANGASTNLAGLRIDAVPAYNGNHSKGSGNGYVVTVGGRRFYFSGDTGDIPEMRALADIDVAFLCMNVPYTMTVAQAAAATRAFQPGVVYPYHFLNQDRTYSDLNAFRRLVGTDVPVEVRIRKWY